MVVRTDLRCGDQHCRLRYLAAYTFTCSIVCATKPYLNIGKYIKSHTQQPGCPPALPSCHRVQSQIMSTTQPDLFPLYTRNDGIDSKVNSIFQCHIIYKDQNKLTLSKILNDFLTQSYDRASDHAKKHHFHTMTADDTKAIHRAPPNRRIPNQLRTFGTIMQFLKPSPTSHHVQLLHPTNLQSSPASSRPYTSN
ncbi:hypothetical protein K402DRAFT_96266 [Aulographum hederae CBS 113979]|uniref:Uncharacterized protein n=1 Tax=Aulographum hederae CBS 113979 TaxID=1176131 RepID=A0A6G1GYB9_9PEZI|nr:hypothetical protein K402DRAFT_96266 [Aulographum hederae CBS 113979]